MESDIDLSDGHEITSLNLTDGNNPMVTIHSNGHFSAFGKDYTQDGDKFGMRLYEALHLFLKTGCPVLGAELLDHGYLKLVETWGSDERIIEAARMSTDSSFHGWDPYYQCKNCRAVWHDVEGQEVPDGVCAQNYGGPCSWQYKPKGDEGLLSYLYNHNHATPFEMGGAIFEVQAPIFVFREWHRHRTQSYNELSARYTDLPALYYVPTKERLLMNTRTKNKQAGTKDGTELTEDGADFFIDTLTKQYENCENIYQGAMDSGVPKELARCIMPVGHYTRMRASANLRNWLAFMTLRSAPNAQWEIRQYSDVINGLLTSKFPRTMELFNAQT